MVPTLTSNLISLNTPFLTETFGFFVATNRAIALLAVLFIKRVSEITSHLFLINGTGRIRIFEYVLLGGNKSKMFCINTIPILANMVNHKSFWNRAIFHKVRHAMSTAAFLSKIEMPVTVPIQVPYPKLTSIFKDPICLKPLCFLIGNSFHVAHGNTF